MKANPTKYNFIPIASWALSLLAAVVVSVIIGIFNSRVTSIGDYPRYIIFVGLNAIFCLFICWNNPRRIWYVPLLCNIVILLPAVFDKSFWTTLFWLIMVLGVGFSFITAYLGARLGKWTVNRELSSKE